MDKKKIFLWALYDFANSIATVVFFLYFSQWLVIEKGVSDIWYNLIFAGSSLLLIITSPIVGAISDKVAVKMPFLNFVTVGQFLFLLAAAFLALFGPSAGAVVIVAGIAYMLASYFYQMQFTFYNALLPEISTPQNRGLISGLGQSTNWLGQIAGLLITLPFITGAIYLFGRSGRAQTFLPATILFFLLSLPMMLKFKEQGTYQKIKINLKQEYKNYFSNFKALVRLPGMGPYLLGYFLFNDALLTAQNNFPIYLQQVFNVDDKIKTFLLLGILASSAIGAFVSGLTADKIGPKKSLMIILVFWLVLFPVLGLVTKFYLFVIASICMGLFYGATWTVTRAMMVSLTPKEHLSHAFSYYTLTERFATFTGPLTWGIISTQLFYMGSIRYRYAVVSLTIFILIGLLIVRKIPAAIKA